MSLILYFAPRSPFARKARIIIHELALVEQVDFVSIDPWNDEELRRDNPLCKVPTLLLENKRALYDSRVICEYLNDRCAGAVFPPPGPDRWDALRRQSLADGISEAVIRRFVERTKSSNDRSEPIVRRQEAAIFAALAALDAATPQGEQFDIGAIAVAAAVGYLEFRSPELGWRTGCGRLAAWFDTVSRRPSIVATQIMPIG